MVLFHLGDGLVPVLPERIPEALIVKPTAKYVSVAVITGKNCAKLFVISASRHSFKENISLLHFPRKASDVKFVLRNLGINF